MEQFWMVWNEGNRAPTVKHDYENMAKAEAERLAEANPGKVFYVLHATDFCQTKRVVWEKLGEPLPF